MPFFPDRQKLLTGATVAASLAVVSLFALRAAELVAYPWDWSPDEGLFLDWGRRLLEDPASLYRRSFVPYPAAYGPGFPALLAPLAVFGPSMLGAARVMALVWTGAWALAVYVLVRRTGGRAAGVAAAALSLAAFDVSFWSMLVRPDGPTLALWLFAAVALLPARLEPGSERLSWRRIAAGSALLVAATLTKPTAVVQGAPLVLGWLLVDRRSALRLMLTVTAVGLLSLALLQLATDGGFLWLQRVWSFHGTQAGLREAILRHSFDRMWPYLAFAAAAAGVAVTRSRSARRVLGEGAWLLLLGAALVVPLLSKYGASWNHLVPIVPALSVLSARWLAKGGVGPALTAAVAVTLAATRPFPLPTELDGRTASAFYAFVKEHTRRSGGPILAMRPELAYFVVGQPVEMEGSCFGMLARHQAPGTELLLERLRSGHYTLLVQLHDLPEAGGFAEAAARGYVHAGGCNLSFYFGTTPVHLSTRKDLPLYLSPPAETRCGGPAVQVASSPRLHP